MPRADVDTDNWSIFSSQGRVLVFLAVCPDAGSRDIARALGLTERATWNLLSTLKNSGMLRIRRDKRRLRYSLNLEAPLLMPSDTDLTLRSVLGKIGRHTQKIDICPPSRTPAPRTHASNGHRP